MESSWPAPVPAAARLARFYPARIDREPVGVWVSLDLTLERYCPPADTVSFSLADSGC